MQEKGSEMASKTVVRVTREEKARQGRLARGETKLVKVEELRPGMRLQGFGGDATFVEATRGPWGNPELHMRSGWSYIETQGAMVEVSA